jgi:septum formation protein
MVPLQDLLHLSIPIVLASASPRRKSLLTQIGMEFIVVPSAFPEESVLRTLPPAEYVQTLATSKAQWVACQVEETALVIGADTVVVWDGEIFNKPTSPAEAMTMLQTLSGKTHTVYTGVALVTAGGKVVKTAVQNTDVTFRTLTEREITAYIATGSPLDKAGAYGIQDDFGAVFVEKIQGCYYNVVGLPLSLLYTMLKEFGQSMYEQEAV